MFLVILVNNDPLSSLASPETETFSNTLVLVLHGSLLNLARLEEMKVKLPHNMLVVDTAQVERSLFKAGYRGAMLDTKTGLARSSTTVLSLESLVRSFGIRELDAAVAHNSGNDAFKCLFSFQMMLEGAKGTPVPPLKQRQRTNSQGLRTPISNPTSPMYEQTMAFGQLSLDRSRSWSRSPGLGEGAGAGSIKRRSYMPPIVTQPQSR